MQNKKIRINGKTNIVKLAAFFGFGSYLSILLEVTAIASVLFACSLLSVAANYFFYLSARKRMKAEDLIFALVAVLTLLLSDWQLNFDYFKQAIIVYCTVLCIDLCVEESVDPNAQKIVTVVILLVAAITVWQYYFAGLRYSYFGSTTLVALNFSNPNATAMWLVFLIVLLCDAVPVQKKYVVQIMLLGCAVAILPILFATNARNSLLAIVFFFTGKLLVRFLKIKKFPAWCTLLITLMPVLVYTGYMYIFLPNYNRLSGWFSFLVSEGKPLTARSRIWSDLEMDTWKKILFGDYAVYHQGQMHNSMVTLFCQFGIFYVVLVCRKMYRVLRKMPNAGMQLALSTVWLTGCFETSFFVGIAGMYMLILLLPIFHKHEICYNIR